MAETLAGIFMNDSQASLVRAQAAGQLELLAACEDLPAALCEPQLHDELLTQVLPLLLQMNRVPLYTHFE